MSGPIGAKNAPDPSLPQSPKTQSHNAWLFLEKMNDSGFCLIQVRFSLDYEESLWA